MPEAEAIIPAPKPYQCGICGKTFGSIQILSRHAQMNHGMDRRMCFLCDVCGQSYKLAQHLQRHMRMHRTVMPYICSVCNKGFFNGTSLIKHEKVHQQYSENTSFQCRICLKSFLRIVDLKEHVKQVHSGPGSAVSPQSSQNVFPIGNNVWRVQSGGNIRRAIWLRQNCRRYPKIAIFPQMWVHSLVLV